MLDDLKVIHERDAQDALGVAEKQWQQISHDFEIEGKVVTDHVYNVVVGGMGGSALAALISTVWPGFTEPFEICRNYEIPNYVDSDTLFIASSYSGNTEETLAGLEAAEKRGAQIAVITSGGKLGQIAREKGYPLVNLPDGFQPRFAALYNLKALLTITDAFGVTTNMAAELSSAKSFLQEAVVDWTPSVPTSQNPAKQLALELMGKSIVVYAGPKMFPAAYKWKISFNENAKNVAWCNQIPEFSHNEMLGWTSHPVDKPYAVIELRSDLEHDRVKKRFVVTEKLLSGRRPSPNVVEVKGESMLEQMLWAITFGDFVSLYLAILNGLNPTPVDLIEKFKKALED